MKIIVLGGGIAGLATSAFLAKQGKHVVVIEKSNSFEDHLALGFKLLQMQKK